jgi:protein involved in polysaccharide export with SLBB domain
MPMKFKVCLFAAGLVLLAFGAQPVVAQSGVVDPGVVELSRPALEELLASYEQASSSTAYSAAMRAQANQAGELIRLRLERGDFLVGDRIALVVEGQTALTATFTVVDGPALVLPDIGRISLEGVLRSELEEHIHRELSRFILRPVVHAQSAIRVMITGGVGTPGWYDLSTRALLTDAVMAAGGPAANADLTAMRIERRGMRILDGEALQLAMAEGRTLDQASLQGGDQIIVPVVESGGIMGGLTVVATVIAVIGAILQIF